MRRWTWIEFLQGLAGFYLGTVAAGLVEFFLLTHDPFELLSSTVSLVIAASILQHVERKVAMIRASQLT